MNLDEFFERLARIAHRYTWRIQGEFLLGHNVSGTTPPWHWDCPLTAVAKDGRDLLRPFLNEWRAAGHHLGLSKDDAARIAYAALYPHVFPSTRRRLLSIVQIVTD